ncbi:MAG: hypothetical protein WD690_08420 [Vicinamibacterales bacterium]
MLPVVTDLERGLRQLGIRFGIVGALVPELLLDARPVRMTNDADVVVVVESLDDFKAVKDALAGYGFSSGRHPHQMHHSSGGRLDILPYSDSLAPDARLELEHGFVLNMAGFRHVVPNTIQVHVAADLTLPLAPLPLYVLLKLVAFSDRSAGKDLDGVFHCLENYLSEDDERRYGVESHGEGVPFEYTPAYVLGLDGRPFADAPVTGTVSAVLARFENPYADVVRMLMTERGQPLPTDQQRADVVAAFSWYRRGLGI